MPAVDRDRSADDTDLSDEVALRRMYRITADADRSFETKVQALLDLGRAYLGVAAGFLSQIDGQTQRIVHASGDHPLLQPDEACPLSEAYCRKTLSREAALTVQHAAIEGWEGDTAYERFGLESYIGAKVLVGDDVYGTFCFADTEPRDRPFTTAEETFVELMAEWVGYELFQRRAAAEIERQRDRLEEFADVLGHDLRNPLNVATGSLELAEETGNLEHFERCRTALERMDGLIDDLLVLARHGETIADTEPVVLDSLLERCWSFVAPQDAAASLEIDLPVDRTITGDASRLEQVFENLFRNAVEHAGPGVTVRVGALDGEPGLYVADDGPGIPADVRERIFTEGYTTGASGAGIGLAIVRRIVEAHGWSIRLAETDDGARFDIVGPALTPAD